MYALLLSSLAVHEIALQAISAIPTTDEASWQWLHKLQAICGDHATLPSSYIISHGLVRVGDHPIASGGSADVWEGTHGDRRVCVKVLRISVNDGQSLAKVRIRNRRVFFVSVEEYFGCRSHSSERPSYGGG